MMGRSHLLSGVVSGLGVCALVDPPAALVPAIVAVSAYSALVPDVDHPRAPAARVLGPVSWALCLFVRWLSVQTTGIAHRGLSHTALFAIGWGLLVGSVALFVMPVLAALWLSAAAVLGCLTHVFGDAITLSGTRHVFWPSPRQLSVPRLFRFRTGGLGEQVVFGALVIAGALLVPSVLG